MNQSHYYIIADKIIKNILIFTLHTNFINCATNSDDITAQADAPLAPALGFSDETHEFLSTIFEEVIESSMEDFLMEYSDSNGLQFIEYAQSTSYLTYASNNGDSNLSVSMDHPCSKTQDGAEQKVFDASNNVKETSANPPLQTVGIINDSILEKDKEDWLVNELNAYIKELGSFIDYGCLFVPIKGRRLGPLYFFAKKCWHINRIHAFLTFDSKTKPNIDNEIYTIKFEKCSFNALDRLKLEFDNGIIIKDNIVVGHNFAVLYYLFKSHPKIAFIIIKYLTYATKDKDIEEFKEELHRYVVDYEKINNHGIKNGPDGMEVNNIILGIKCSKIVCLKNLLNYTNLFIGFLRLHCYNKISTKEEKSEWMDYFTFRGNIEKSEKSEKSENPENSENSENFVYWYKFPWVDAVTPYR